MSETSSAPIVKRKRTGLLVLGLLVLFTGLWVVAIYVGYQTGFFDRSDTEAQSLSVEMHFKGTQFTIKNTSDDDWGETTIEINDGYSAVIGRIQAGETATIGALQFANQQGIRFNPYTMKPQQVSIRVLSGGKERTYKGAWD